MQKIATNLESLDRARALQNTSTDFERALWVQLRDRRLRGFKFKRQVTLGPYIVDYLCHEARLIIELDGAQHFEQAAYDMQRTGYLERCGFQVLRYWNSDLSNNLEGVLYEVDRCLYRH
jgi:very-short-patch-repair endonuclease